MLDRQGLVTARFFEQAYQERSTIGIIIARLSGLSSLTIKAR
jgi:hypothetical protein